MKWGVRKIVRQTNKYARRYNEAYDRSKNYYESHYPNISKRGTKEYSKMVHLKIRENQAKEAHFKQMRRAIDSLSKKDLSLGYDFVNRTYYLEQKKRTQSDYVEIRI